ncbi:MAG: FecR domain-containing protein [Deltaproteobacteria bacterium]|nr:FecR domain-containing protein [Deltaproteobacteria bacterium]
MKKYLAITACFIVLGALFPLVAQAAPVGKFTYIAGKVDIISSGKAVKSAKMQEDVHKGDVIQVKKESKAEITFLDDSVLRIAPDTRVEISEYFVGEGRVVGILNLAAGKIQSTVRKTFGMVFGLKNQSRFEIHTPTAVIGVRGTDFFTSFLAGITEAVFKKEKGYIFSLNLPDIVEYINTGEKGRVVSPDRAPSVSEATAAEINALTQELAPWGKSEEDKIKDIIKDIKSEILNHPAHYGHLDKNTILHYFGLTSQLEKAEGDLGDAEAETRGRGDGGGG